MSRGGTTPRPSLSQHSAKKCRREWLPAGAAVAVRFSGPDPLILRQLADEALAIYEAAGTIIDPRTDWRQRELRVVPIVDESRMRLTGATRQAIAEASRRNAEALRAMGMAPAFQRRWREANCAP